MADISLIEGDEWMADLRWHNDESQFAIFFGEDLGFLYDVVDGEGFPCDKCGVWHQPWAPHAPTMAFLEHFVLENMRLPHWCDLVVTCPEDVQSRIREYLDALGQWSEPKDEMTVEDATARTVGGMPVHTKERDPRSMSKVVEPKLRAKLSQFVGMPNDERARAAVADAIHETLRPIFDARVEVEADFSDSEKININVAYESVAGPREMNSADAVFILRDGDFRDADGEGQGRPGSGQPAAHSSASRGGCEDSPDVSSPGGKPGMEGVDGLGEGRGLRLRRDGGE